MFVAALAKSRTPLGADGDDLLTALRRTHPGEVAGAASDGPFVAAQTLIRSTPQSHDEKVPAADPATGRLLASWVRLDNRDQLACDLGWSRDRARRATDPDHVLAAYDRWGTDCVEHLHGDFAFALWDPQRRGVFAARDRTGIRPLFYADAPAAFACATTTACLADIPTVDMTVRPEWLAQYLHTRSRTWDATPFTGVNKLPPGHCLWADEDGVVVHRYHRFVDDSPWQDRRDDRWLAAYRDLLVRSIADRTRTDSPIGAENSGGIDSATMVCLIPQTRPGVPLFTYGYAHHELEPDFITAAADSARVPLERRRMWRDAQGSVDAAVLGWRALGYPVEHGNAISHVTIYEAARADGVRLLHSGHGGDEVVTQAAGHAITEALDRRRYLALAADMPGPAWQRPARVARAWWRGRRPAESHLHRPLMDRLASTPLTPEAFDAADIQAATLRAAEFDAPYRTVNSFILGNRWSPATSTRTADCSVVAASYGLEYVWPLLDARLMQQYLSTPTVWKFGKGHGRYLHRRAITGTVPDTVAWKPSKNMRGPSDDARLEDRSWLRPPDRGYDELNPAVRDLIDPVAWRRGPLPDSDRGGARPYHEVVTLSDWLDDRA